MSEVYVLEPATSARVVLKTSAGEIDLELWAKECPKTCRNFIQLCLEGYYDGSEFHRVVPGVLIQGGDKTGTGDGGASIYSSPEEFPDEFHPRLKWRYRGLLGVANKGKGTKTNNSQFFITLSRAETLNNQSSLFGKVVGTTIYNVIRIGETELGDGERPRVPPVIQSTDVILNPFTDIVPRVQVSESDRKAAVELDASRARKDLFAVKKSSLVSFRDDEDESEDDIELEDGKESLSLLKPLSSIFETENTLEHERSVKIAEELRANDEKINKIKNKIACKMKDSNQKPCAEEVDSSDEENNLSEIEEQTNRMDRRNEYKTQEIEKDETCLAEVAEQESQKIDKEINLGEEYLTVGAFLQSSGSTVEYKREGGGTLGVEDKKIEEIQETDLLTGWESKWKLKRNEKRIRDSKKKESEIIQKFHSFKRKLDQLIDSSVDQPENDNNKISKEQKNEYSVYDDEDDDDDFLWAKNGLKFAVDSNRAYEYDSAKDSLSIVDPLLNRPDLQDQHRSKLKNRKMPTVGVDG